MGVISSESLRVFFLPKMWSELYKLKISVRRKDMQRVRTGAWNR